MGLVHGCGLGATIPWEQWQVPDISRCSGFSPRKSPAPQSRIPLYSTELLFLLILLVLVEFNVPWWLVIYGCALIRKASEVNVLQVILSGAAAECSMTQPGPLHRQQMRRYPKKKVVEEIKKTKKRDNIVKRERGILECSQFA